LVIVVFTAMFVYKLVYVQN